MKPTNQVSNLINCLTKDEDQRQELWVHYLSGNSESTFASYLEKLNNEFCSDSMLQEHLWIVLKQQPSDKFYRLLSALSEVERSVVTLLALGLTVVQVSKYKGISETRIRQVISVLKEHDCWDEIYGAEKKTYRTREIRS